MGGVLVEALSGGEPLSGLEHAARLKRSGSRK
jgi:hypothetical protein